MQIDNIPKFNAIAYNGKLEKILKGLFGIAFANAPRKTTWVAMDKLFNNVEEDMTIYVSDLPSSATPSPTCDVISIEFKHTMDIDSKDCEKSAKKAVDQVSKYNQNSHKYIIHFLSVYSRDDNGNIIVFENSPHVVTKKYSQLKGNFSGKELIKLYRSMQSNLTITHENGEPIIIYEEPGRFKIECYIFRVN